MESSTWPLLPMVTICIDQVPLCTIDQVTIGHGVTWPNSQLKKYIGQMPPCTIDQVSIGHGVTWSTVIFSKSIGQMPSDTTNKYQ